METNYSKHKDLLKARAQQLVKRANKHKKTTHSIEWFVETEQSKLRETQEGTI